jgi:hypothetical protein
MPGCHLARAAPSTIFITVTEGCGPTRSFEEQVDDLAPGIAAFTICGPYLPPAMRRLPLVGSLDR